MMEEESSNSSLMTASRNPSDEEEDTSGPTSNFASVSSEPNPDALNFAKETFDDLREELNRQILPRLDALHDHSEVDRVNLENHKKKFADFVRKNDLLQIGKEELKKSLQSLQVELDSILNAEYSDDKMDAFLTRATNYDLLCNKIRELISETEKLMKDDEFKSTELNIQHELRMAVSTFDDPELDQISDPEDLLHALIAHYNNALKEQKDLVSQSTSKQQELQQKVDDLELEAKLTPNVQQRQADILTKVQQELYQTEEALENELSDNQQRINNLNQTLLQKDLEIQELKQQLEKRPTSEFVNKQIKEMKKQLEFVQNQHDSESDEEHHDHNEVHEQKGLSSKEAQELKEQIAALKKGFKLMRTSISRVSNMDVDKLVNVKRPTRVIADIMHKKKAKKRKKRRKSVKEQYFSEIDLVLSKHPTRKSNDNHASLPIPNIWRIEKVADMAEAIITYEDTEIRRRMRDFQWLWRALDANKPVRGTAERVPDLPLFALSDSQRSTCDRVLSKAELNNWLKGCHSRKWIRNYEAWKIFVAPDKNFKWLRHHYDQRSIRADDKLTRRTITRLHRKRSL